MTLLDDDDLNNLQETCLYTLKDEVLDGAMQHWKSREVK